MCFVPPSRPHWHVDRASWATEGQTGMWAEPVGRQKGRLGTKQMWFVHGSLDMSLALSQNCPTIDIKHLERETERW